MADFRQSIVNVAEICARKGMSHVVLSPGSRSAPLTLAFVRHPGIACRMVVDERSAAYVALGIAQQTQQPVGLVCTSGTAALNYAPAVAEAYFQRVPLVVFTADRPPEWIAQQDNQTIFQRHLYGRHCRAFFELPVDTSHADARWHARRLVSDALNASLWPVPGPVHVNVPLREPLYPEDAVHFDKDVQVIGLEKPDVSLSSETWRALAEEWRTCGKKMVVAGLHNPNTGLAEALRTLNNRPDVVVLGDVTSNLQEATDVFLHDLVLSATDERLPRHLLPDMLITFGGPIVSKSLKSLLRRCPPRAHWHLQLDAPAADTFQVLTRQLPVPPEKFFGELVEEMPPEQTGDYAAVWESCEQHAEAVLTDFWASGSFSELLCMKRILNKLPKPSHLQLGNSSIVRLANLIGLRELRQVRVNANRGTSGIDGTVSTAVGAATQTQLPTTLITGDLAFFYDRNALWNDFVPQNLRIIVFNNRGGGIFRLLDGARQLPELESWFVVNHDLTVEQTASQHDLGYFACRSQKELTALLPEFYSVSTRPRLLEIFFDRQVSVDSYFHLKSLLKEIS